MELNVQGAVASLTAGDRVELRTRALNHHDHLCGNEEVLYPPLAHIWGGAGGGLVANSFRGAELGKTWSSPGKRSAFGVAPLRAMRAGVLALLLGEPAAPRTGAAVHLGPQTGRALARRVLRS